VGVVESETRRLRYEGNATHAVPRNVWRALLGGAVNINGNELAVPVQLLRRVGVVVDIDYDLFAFGEADERTWKLSVVERGRNDTLRR